METKDINEDESVETVETITTGYEPRAPQKEIHKAIKNNKFTELVILPSQ